MQCKNKNEKHKTLWKNVIKLKMRRQKSCKSEYDTQMDYTDKQGEKITKQNTQKKHNRIKQ